MNEMVTTCHRGLSLSQENQIAQFPNISLIESLVHPQILTAQDLKLMQALAHELNKLLSRNDCQSHELNNPLQTYNYFIK